MLKVLFTIFLAIDLSALAGVIGRLTVSRSDGLTGAAVIFWYVLFGFAVGLIAGIFISRFLSQKVLKILNYILGIIALAVIMFVFYRLNNIELIESGLINKNIIYALFSFSGLSKIKKNPAGYKPEGIS